MIAACSPGRKTSRTPPLADIRTERLDLLDSARSRRVPVTIYAPQQSRHEAKRLPVVIVNHGYGENKSGANEAYTYITHFLAARGYFVASIQHELPTDELMPMTGKPQDVRRPFWERGTQNILYVLNELKRTQPELDYQHVSLIGHSNGGDMVMLFAQKYPSLIDKAISLDNRRMLLPRVKHPSIYSLRSTDQPADEGVLPTLNEQQRFHIRVIKLPATNHNDMDDDANEQQRREIDDYLLQFLKE